MEKEAKDPDDKQITVFMLGFVIGVVMALIPTVIGVATSPRYDTYSLALTGVDGVTRPAAGPGISSPLSPAFNLTLYVDNTRFIQKNCFGYGRVAVSYGGVVMGEVRVPGWCAGTRSTAKVELLVRGKDVRLPDGLRRRLEAELRWGTAELDVEATLFRDSEARAPVLLRCKAVGLQVPPQPLECKAFITDYVF